MATRRSKQAYANELIISQLYGKETYEKLVRFVAENFDSLDDTLHYIHSININDAKKKWLDLIGIIVGLDRKISSSIGFGYFNFAEYPGAEGFDTGRWYEEGDPLTSTSLLPDSEYRIALYAQIAKNYGDVSAPGIVYALQNMLGSNATIKVTRLPGANMNIFISAYASNNFKILVEELDIVPRAAGIGYNIVIAPPDASDYFGYSDLNPLALTYGEGSYADLGGA